MDLAGRHTSQFDHPALSLTSQLFRLHFYANGFLLRKNLPSFSSGCYVCWCVGLQRLVGCDIWYSWWDGACRLLADPSSPCRRSSIRPEPLEADLSEHHTQVVTLSSSSLATAASADLFHCNTQLLSYRLTKLHMADLPVESRAKNPVVSFREWINDENHTGTTPPPHTHTLHFIDTKPGIWNLKSEEMRKS